jgi:hypothetical protein
LEPKKPYITRLEEKAAAYKNALDLFIAWTEAEEKVNNTAYKRDASKLADIAKAKAIAAIKEARKYEEQPNA